MTSFHIWCVIYLLFSWCGDGDGDGGLVTSDIYLFNHRFKVTVTVIW